MGKSDMKRFIRTDPGPPCANSSYDLHEGIRISKLMEAHRYGFLAEP